MSMGWLNPENIASTEGRAEAHVSEFLRAFGELGRLALEAWDTVDPLHCAMMPDEYLVYARKFIEQSAQFILQEWENHPGLGEEIVRRCFAPTQVCYHIGLDESFVSDRDIKAIAEQISRGVAELGGWATLYPTPNFSV